MLLLMYPDFYTFLLKEELVYGSSRVFLVKNMISKGPPNFCIKFSELCWIKKCFSCFIHFIPFSISKEKWRLLRMIQN